MNHLNPDVPIIGQTARVVIHTISIAAPNMVEVSDNGLDCGESIAHIRVTNPIKGEQWRVPLTGDQVERLLMALEGVAQSK